MPRPWNEIDWSQPRPSVSELISSWPRLRWEPRTPESPALGAYLAEVARTHANGGYLLGQWRAVEYSDVAQWFISRNRLDEYELFRLLFTRHRPANAAGPRGPRDARPRCRRPSAACRWCSGLGRAVGTSHHRWRRLPPLRRYRARGQGACRSCGGRPGRGAVRGLPCRHHP